MEKREIYLDNSATTRVFPEVVTKMASVYLESYGNPSSLHRKGIEAEKVLRDARETFMGILKCGEKNLLFTSGGTESDNLAILGGAKAAVRRGRHLITSQIEHPAVLQTMKHLEEEGFEVTYLPVSSAGLVDPEALEAAIRPDTTLVSVMYVNNEIGSVQPIAEIGERIRKKNPATLFHVDAVQGFGKLPILPKKEGIDLMSVSSHKLHGPKGVGLLYVGDGVKLLPICYGGGQQRELRSGTENVPGIAGMALAAQILTEHLSEDAARMRGLKEKLVRGALELGKTLGEGSVLVNGGTDPLTAAPHIVNIAFPGVRSEVLLHALEDDGIYVSAGSACSSHKPQPSKTLTAIGAPKQVIESSLRFSFSVESTEEEVEETLRVLGAKLPILRKFIAG